MCLLCDQARRQRFQAIQSDTRALYGLSIAPVELLDNNSVAITRSQTATDGILDYYMHAPGGAVAIGGGGFGGQTIQSNVISLRDQNFFNDVVRRLDSIIDLDFRQVNISAVSDVDLYYDTEINTGGSGVTLGLATTGGEGGWELFVNYPQLQNDENYRRYVLIHEFGHSLGLEHPFESRDGDVLNGITDPWNSAFPEETVMAYREPATGTRPEFFTDNDLNALIEVWGAETRVFGDGGDFITGAAHRDILLGAGGDDELRGRQGSDRVEGGRGNDQVMGGDGPDELFGGSGNDAIFGGFGHDMINGGAGSDQIRGGYGGDLFLLSAGQDVIEDFRLSENDRLGLRSGTNYEFQQQGNDLQVITSLGTTTLWGVDLGSFLGQNRVVTV